MGNGRKVDHVFKIPSPSNNLAAMPMPTVGSLSACFEQCSKEGDKREKAKTCILLLTMTKKFLFNKEEFLDH